MWFITVASIMMIAGAITNVFINIDRYFSVFVAGKVG